MDEVRQRVKTAGLMLKESDLKDNAAAAVGAYAKLPLQMTVLGLLASMGTGAGAGYGLAKMQDTPINADSVKHQELLAAYREQAEKARRNAASRRMSSQAPSPPRLYTP